MKAARLFLMLPLLAACNAQEKAPVAASQVSSVASGSPAVIVTPVMPAAVASAPAVVASVPVAASVAVVRPVRKAARKTIRIASAPLVTSQLVALDRYQQALVALRHGRVSETQAHLRAQLQAEPAHQGARKLLVTLLLDTGKRTESEVLLADGLKLDPAQTDLVMLQARLQADRGALPVARATLQQSVEYAQKNGPYLAFMGALAQQAGQHDVALIHLAAALELSPGNGQWLLAQGVSRQVLGQMEEAQESITLARQSGQLNAEQQKLAKQLQARVRR